MIVHTHYSINSFNQILEFKIYLFSLRCEHVTSQRRLPDFTEMREKIITFKFYFITGYCFVIFFPII